MQNKRFIIALSVSFAVHVALIPLLAIYGVHICPVLNERGFSFGCKYNAAFVLASLALSAIANTALFVIFKRETERGARTFTLRQFSAVSGLLHFTVFILSLLYLCEYLDSLGLPGPSLVRMVAALSIASIFLSILQSEILGLAVQDSLRNDPHWHTLDDLARQVNTSSATPTSSPNSSPTSSSPSLSNQMLRRWLSTELARSAPYWACLMVVIIYGVSKIIELKELYDVDDYYLESRGHEALQILGLAAVWLVGVQFLKMKKERALFKDLNEHVTQLSSGRVDHFSREVSSGLWQDLFQFLNRTTLAMAQRLRLIKGLSAYATGSVTENVMHKEELHTFGSRRKIAILMSDLRGFTAMSNNLEPEAVVQILNMYFEAMIDVCTKNDLIVDKFIGDGLLAYVDAAVNEPSSSQCAKALHASHEMLARLDSLNVELQRLGFQKLSIGIGLHFGDVVVGSIGSKDRLQHTIIGDAVNTAARLEAQCKGLQATIVASSVLVTEARSSESNDLAWPKLKTHAPIEVRGIANAVDIFILPAA